MQAMETPAELADRVQDELDDAASDHLYLTDHAPPFIVPEDCGVCGHEWRCVCPADRQ